MILECRRWFAEKRPLIRQKPFGATTADPSYKTMAIHTLVYCKASLIVSKRIFLKMEMPLRYTTTLVLLLWPYAQRVRMRVRRDFSKIK